MMEETTKIPPENTKLDYDLTCWYLNLRRVSELVGSTFLTSREVQRASALGNEHYLKIVILEMAKRELVHWIQTHKPQTFGHLLLTGQALPGMPFTHFSDFYCTGLSQQGGTSRKRKSKGSPYVYCDVKGLGHDVRLRLTYHPEHLTCASSYEWLSGHRQLFIFALMGEEHNGEVEALPLVIATPIPQLGNASNKGIYWNSRLEVLADSIDSFSFARNEPYPSKSELQLLRTLSEDTIKHAFAEIIYEQTIPNDWGGEHSDLYSTHVLLNEERISTAFVFKGPAKFSPMKTTHLGKNGDQIERLFCEPADLLILQHCHEITPSIRQMMRAYATRVSDLRLFSLIDGYDTLRILRAYSKCAFTPTATR